jgi:hypothetical protein
MPSILKFINSITNNHDLVLESVQENGLDLKYANEKLRNNKEICLAAVKQNPKAIKFALMSLNEMDYF